MTEEQPRWYKPCVYGLMLLAVALRLFYLLYTHRTWEDALITARHSENFARGLGLTAPVPPGARPVQGFTSPLGVLIPVVGDLVRPGLGLLLLKFVSMFAAAASVWLSAALARLVKLPAALALTAAAFLAVEHHQILFGMAGMETQVVVLCYLFVLYSLFCGSQWQTGVAVGLAMLARPDAVFLVLIAVSLEIWRAGRTGKWNGPVRVVTGLALLYTPWLLFTWLDYGTPIPNTVLAKSLGYPTPWQQLHRMSVSPLRVVFRLRLLAVFQSLGPSYGGNGTGLVAIRDHGAVAMVMLLLVVVGAVVAVRRRHVEALTLFAFVLTYELYLGAEAPVIFTWYTIPVAAVAVIGSCYGLWALAERLLPKTREQLLAVAGSLYILMFVTLLPLTMRSDKYLQIRIDEGVRKQVGLYLARVSSPSDAIASESLGYIGYYSGRIIYDYPGLGSPVVIQYLREHPAERNMAAMMRHLRPAYLVLRPSEYQGNGAYAWLVGSYKKIAEFKASPDTRKRILMPDRNVDYEFHVFRRIDVEDPSLTS